MTVVEVCDGCHQVDMVDAVECGSCPMWLLRMETSKAPWFPRVPFRRIRLQTRIHMHTYALPYAMCNTLQGHEQLPMF